MNTTNLPSDDETGLYEICLKGHLVDRWISHFGDVNITLEDSGITKLNTMVADQAALFGLLKKIRDVGLPLISVNRIKPDGRYVVEEQIINQIHSIKGDSK